MFNFGKSASHAGFEITPEGITGVILEKHKKQFFLKKFAFEAFNEPEKDVIRRGAIVKEDVFAESLEKFIEKHKFETDSASLSISSNAAFIKNITMPNIPYEELKLIIAQEAEKHISLPISDVNIDFDVIENSTNSDKNDVILVTLEKNIAKTFVNCFHDVGFSLENIDVASFAMIKTLEKTKAINEANELYLAILIDYDTTDITIIKNGMPVFCHNVSIGKKDILEGMLSFSENEEETENILNNINNINDDISIEPSSIEENKAVNAIKNVYKNITSEIFKTIEFYNSQSDLPITIKEVLIAGCGVISEDADKFIQSKIKIPTSTCKPLNIISLNPENNFTDLSNAKLTVAIGLAMKGLEN